jgi:flagellar hook-associated protein 3 FlgL
MSIGTPLFHALNVRAFSRLDGDISSLQNEISSGKNDHRPSADTIRALKLSAAEEHKNALDRFGANLDRAESRLDMTDTNMESVVDTLQRMSELAVRGASNISPAERESLRQEVVQLRDMLIDTANATDATGRPIFGGHLPRGQAFVDGPNGVEYMGDAGTHRLRVSESSFVQTGVNGAETFQSIPDGANGETSLFEMADDFLRTLQPDGELMDTQLTGEGSLELSFNLTREARDWSMTLEGPAGSVDLNLSLSANAPDVLVDAVNAQSGNTGITASLGDDGASIVFSAAGLVSVKDASVEPAVKGAMAEIAVPSEGPRLLVKPHQVMENQIDRLRTAADHFADLRARVGALGAAVDERQDALIDRQTQAEKVVSGMEDLDIAQAITKLQHLMTVRQVSQQSYVKIGQTTLFDYLR